MSDYPEHDKQSAIIEDARTIDEFIEWLGSRGMFIAEHQKLDGFRDPILVPIPQAHQQVVMDFYGIDGAKLEDERRAMLASLRA